ncbi:hypothetical protein GOBAR_DD11326 [Gossypium barbadense]|nr:hypothetical protein GOBAR_DD11326 [Gossypium barbadense]
MGFRNSYVGNVSLFYEIEEKLKQGCNVVLISNHQTEADPIIISLLLEKANPHIAENMLYSLCEKTIISISAGKYWAATATATAIGDVYMWDGKKSMEKPLVATWLHRVKGKKIP